jgi:hypothetical protein
LWRMQSGRNQSWDSKLIELAARFCPLGPWGSLGFSCSAVN